CEALAIAAVAGDAALLVDRLAAIGPAGEFQRRHELWNYIIALDGRLREHLLCQSFELWIAMRLKRQRLGGLDDISSHFARFYVVKQDQRSFGTLEKHSDSFGAQARR